MRGSRLIVVVAVVAVAVIATLAVSTATPGTDEPPPLTPLRPASDPGSGEPDFVVAPDGDDAAPGTPDAPFATLDRARAAARTRAAEADRDIVIWIRDGVHRLADPLHLGAADSGDDGADIVYRAAPGATPVLSGGVPVGDWARVDGDRGLWTARLGTDVQPRQMFVDGRRAVRARSARNPAGFARTERGYTPGIDGMASWRNVADIEIVGFSLWRDYHCGVAEITATEVVVDQPCWEFATTQPPIGEPAWIENAFELLDEPGEWYHDRATGEVFYRPRPGESMRDADVVVGGGPHVVVGDGVHHVRFEGLTFAHTGWTRPDSAEGYAPIQTGWLQSSDGILRGVPGAVHLSNVYEVDLAGNAFTALGTAGVVLDDGSRQVRISGNRFADIASHAISIGEVEDDEERDVHRMHRDIEVSNNVITTVGREYRDAVGVFMGFVRNVHVVNNEISDVPYSGITMGWGWGEQSYARDNRIAHNRIDGFLRVLNDGGGVYTLSPQPGTEIAFNHISDNVGMYGCLYPDEGSAGMRWHHNVCERLNDADDSTGQWLHIWTDSIRDLEITDNYTDTAVLENDGTDIVLRDTTVMAPGSPPAQAQQIIDEAGLSIPLREWRR